MPRRLIALLGPTASGKTTAAVAIARRLSVEVISADSRQVRSEMRIGTAAPTAKELAAVPHHLIGVVPPDAPWSLADFLARAREALDDIWAREKLPLLVGGTGQYVWALLEGWQPPAVPPDPELRHKLEAEAAAHGPEPLIARLEALDPGAAARIDRRNPRRLIRAIEVALASSGPAARQAKVSYSQPSPSPAKRERGPGGEGPAHPESAGRRIEGGAPPATNPPIPSPSTREGEEGGDGPSGPPKPAFTWHAIGLHWSREAIHARADARVDQMYAAGLVEETRDLLARYPADLPAFQTIGYAEAARVLSGEWDLATAIERTKIATHRLIRMQTTWFRRDDPRIEWVDGANLDAVTRVVEGSTEARVR